MADTERKPQLVFWFDFASTYSYLTAMRIDELAAQSGVEVRWNPILLGPIFKAQGWDTSPFNIYPAKGKYMFRDMERLTKAYGLPFKMPETFPAHSLAAARIAHAWNNEDTQPDFCRAVFRSQFAEGRDISDPDLLLELTTANNGNPDVIRDVIADPDHKNRLRMATQLAQDVGIFGAPSFTTSDGELFWGDDRLNQAMEHERIG